MKDALSRLNAEENRSPAQLMGEPDGMLDEDPSGGVVALEFVGDFVWADLDSGALVDFERLVLGSNGLYAARVVATLVNPGVRSFGGHPCMLPEEGEWNTYLVSGKTRLRVRPTTGRARVYAVGIADGVLHISRRGQSAALFRVMPHSGEVPVVSAEPHYELRSA